MELSDEFVLELTQAQQRLLSYIYRRVANREQAQEVLQQTNLVLCRKANEFEPGTNFNAWAVTVAQWTMVSLLRFVIAWRKGMWMVTGTARRPGQASIITGRVSALTRNAKYSVWPG